MLINNQCSPFYNPHHFLTNTLTMHPKPPPTPEHCTPKPLPLKSPTALKPLILCLTPTNANSSRELVSSIHSEITQFRVHANAYMQRVHANAYMDIKEYLKYF